MGGPLRVYYDPRDPTRAAARSEDFPGGAVEVVLSLLAGAIGLACLRAGGW